MIGWDASQSMLEDNYSLFQKELTLLVVDSQPPKREIGLLITNKALVEREVFDP